MISGQFIPIVEKIPRETAKTQTVAAKIDIFTIFLLLLNEIHDFHYFHCCKATVQVVLWPTRENSEYHGISDRFFELSRSVFRVRPSYLIFRELSEYVFRKIKSFCEKIFFRDEGSIFDQKFSHLLQSDPSFIRHFFTKNRHTG